MNKFSEKLKELRIEKSLTQVELAKATNLSQAAIAKWESGKRTPTMECLIILSEYFGITIDYLVGKEEY